MQEKKEVVKHEVQNSATKMRVKLRRQVRHHHHAVVEQWLLARCNYLLLAKPGK